MISAQQSTHPINQTKPLNQNAYDLNYIPLLDMEAASFPNTLVQTFKNIGFVIIHNHGIDKDIIDEAFQRSREMFMLENQVKRSVAFNSKDGKGYSGQGSQNFDGIPANDKKQTYDLGHPDIPGELQYYPPLHQTTKFMGKFFDQLFETHKKIMVAIEKGLGLEEKYITRKCCQDVQSQSLRFLYYPQVTVGQIKETGIVRCGPHSDYGTITLLLQKPGEGQNGLRALNSEKKWVKVNPPDYSMVVNLGDIFHHWSNDQLISTIHKVEVDQDVMELLEQGQIQKSPERQSIALFCYPNRGQVFECMPCFGKPKYAPMSWEQYLSNRVKSTYGSAKY